ncbi:MAG: MFS transporter [Bryobacteraceae bacterium]|nr:MFS transporter [Bryobacteraceae bacterium]
MSIHTATRLDARQRPTRARHWVIVFAVTLAVLAYIDRVCISQAAPIMMHDLGLSRVQMGWVFSAFALAYALFEIPGGWLGDRMGPRRVLMRIVIWWSAFTALTGAVSNYVVLLIVRFMFGAGEAGCFPNLTKSFTIWLPERERVRAQGIMWMFARWGGAFTPPLVIFVFSFMSWRWAFGLFGALGIIWAVFFYRWFRDNPANHKSVNAAELALLEGSEHLASGHGDVPWGKLATYRTAWMLWAQYFFVSYPWYFFITWLPSYLQEYRGLSPEVSAGYAIFPLLFGGCGCLISGLLLPKLEKRVGMSVGRRVMAIIGFAGAAVFMALHTQFDAILPAMIAMGMASFCNDLTMPPAWGACMDVGGKYAGTLAGSMNMMGNMAGFAAPAMGGWIVQQTGGNWNVFLYVMAGMYVLGGLCWPFIDPVTPLEKATRRA